MERAPELEERTRQLYDAMGRGDADFLRDLVSRADGVTAIATDPEEWWEDYETITRIWGQQLAEAGGFVLEDANPRAYASGEVGWVADRPTFRLPDGTALPIRITGVYRREDGAWRLVQWHASIGVSNEEAIGMELTTE